MDIDAQNSLVDTAFNTSYAESLANFLVGRYAEPSLRVSNINTHTGDRDEFHDAFLSLDVNDRVVVRRRPPGYTDELTTSTTRTTTFGLPNALGV